MDVTTDSTTAVAMVAFRPSVRATRIAAGWLDTEAFAWLSIVPPRRGLTGASCHWVHPTGIEAARTLARPGGRPGVSQAGRPRRRYRCSSRIRSTSSSASSSSRTARAQAWLTPRRRTSWASSGPLRTTRQPSTVPPQAVMRPETSSTTLWSGTEVMCRMWTNWSPAGGNSVPVVQAVLPGVELEVSAMGQGEEDCVCCIAARNWITGRITRTGARHAASRFVADHRPHRLEATTLPGRGRLALVPSGTNSGCRGDYSRRRGAGGRGGCRTGHHIGGRGGRLRRRRDGMGLPRLRGGAVSLHWPGSARTPAGTDA